MEEEEQEEDEVEEDEEVEEVEEEKEEGQEVLNCSLLPLPAPHTDKRHPALLFLSHFSPECI